MPARPSILAGIILSCCAANTGAQASVEKADLLIVHGKVYTADGGAFREAVAIRGNKILRVGDTTEILNLRGLADFVVLADDLHTVAQDKIKDIEIVRTVVGGSTVYEA